MRIQHSRDFVIEQAKENIAFIKASPSNLGQAKQINTALANIVAMERNMVMHRAVERMISNDNQDVPRLPEPASGPEGD